MNKNGVTVKYKTLKNIVPVLFKAGDSLPRPLPKIPQQRQMASNRTKNAPLSSHISNSNNKGMSCFSPNQSFNCVCNKIASKDSCLGNPICS